MAIQIPNPGTGNGASGDNEFVLWSKVKDNFNDQTNAASKLVGTGAEQIPLSKNIPSLLGTAATKNVGTEAGNVMEVGAFGLGGSATFVSTNTSMSEYIAKVGSKSGFIYSFTGGATGNKPFEDYSMGFTTTLSGDTVILGLGVTGTKSGYIAKSSSGNITNVTFWTDKNATKDSNGFLKGASPVIDMYDNKMDLNEDAQKQGGITFEKLGVGDYLIKGSLGFAKEGWHIETPKDTNGNVLVAVVETQLENNDLSIKSYAKRFDEETGDIIPNLTKPRDIPDGRFISLRLHELPKEPPVMPDNIQVEQVILDKE